MLSARLFIEKNLPAQYDTIASRKVTSPYNVSSLDFPVYRNTRTIFVMDMIMDDFVSRCLSEKRFIGSHTLAERKNQSNRIVAFSRLSTVNVILLYILD